MSLSYTTPCTQESQCPCLWGELVGRITYLQPLLLAALAIAPHGLAFELRLLKSPLAF